MDKEKNIKNAITLLDAILNNWKKRNSKEKEYYIFFPKFSTEDNKFTALFPIFEKNTNTTLELAAWGEYDLETYTLSQYIGEEKEIIIDKNEIENYKDEKFEDLLEAFVKVFYGAQNFKKFEEGSEEYKSNKKKLVNDIYDYEDIFINDISDVLNDVYGIEYDEEDVEIDETVIEDIEDVDDGDEFADLLSDDEEEIVSTEDEIEEEVEDIVDVDDGDEFADLLSDDEEEVVNTEDEIEEVVDDEDVDDEDEFADLITDDEEEIVSTEDEIEEVVEDFIDVDDEDVDDEDEFADLITDDEEKVDIEDKIEEENAEKIDNKDEEEIENTDDEEEIISNNEDVDTSEENTIEKLRKELLQREKKILKEQEKRRKEKKELTSFNPYEFPEGSEDVKYEFEWKNKQGLKYVSDKSLKIAYELIKKGEIKLTLKKDEKYPRVVVNSCISNLCTEKYSTDELIEGLEKDEPTIKNIKIFKDDKNDRNDFTMRVDISTDKVCHGCELDRCPKLIAGYVLYLRNMGLLENELKERETFRKEHKDLDDIYNFIWEVEDGLKYVPQNIFEFAEELVNNDKVYIQNNLSTTGLIEIYSPVACADYKLLETEKESINLNKPFESWLYIRRTPAYKISLCNDYGCRLDSCPIVVAGYMYYLKKIDREDLIIKDRLYYLDNKEEIDKKIQEEKRNKIEELENKKNDVLTNFKNQYEEKISNFHDFSDNILNESQENLHCTVEGKDNIGKNKFLSEVANLLNKVGKTNNINWRRISLQNLAASNAYSYTNKANNVNADINGIFYQTEGAMKYTELLERQLYVVNGITEFIEDYRRYKTAGSNEFVEIRKRQFEHVFELLTKMNLRNYIILDGTEEEIDNLLEIEPRLQFIYKNYRFKLPDPSMDEIYKLYIQALKPELLEAIREKYEEYKKQFIEYIMLNKNFIPLSDRELANYLAMYSNSKKQIVFPENIYKKETIEESLKNIIGLENVKNKVAEFEKYMIFQMKAKTAGINLGSSNMHMIFTGNPGTGKTTIARIMAKMLFDLGIIKENKLVEVERKDLIANYIGQTATKTAEMIDKAMGGVLFIDEAYELAGKGERDFGLEAIATLIKAMEDHKNEFVVIFAGYKNEMKTFIDSNPGIASRIGYTFDFPDYTPEELIKIFNKKMNNMGFEIDKSVETKLNSICKYFSKRKAFGNGRFVDKLIQETIMKHAKRDVDDIKLITVEDIPEIEDLNNTKNEDDNKDVKELLKNVIGMEKLKEKIIEFEEYVSFLKEAENNKLNIPNQNMHMIFTGNPGTGKTTIARIMAKMLFDLGMIHENKLIEVERKDLIAEYIGQTAVKTSQVIEKAMGGVLFIDEAYTLNSGYKNDFGHEAIGTLIKAMEDHKGEFVVIFAGYKDEMKGFIDMNPGIASRIGYTFDFPDYTDTELAEILYKKIDHSGMTISNDSKEAVEKIMKYFCNVENIGNGRFVDKVLQEILMNHAKNKKRKIGKIQKEEIPSIKEMTDVIFNGNGMIDVDQITEDDLKKTATHEVGHACVRLLLFKEPGIKKITINAEGTGALGYVRHSGNNSYTSSKTTLLNNIKVSLAGMVAEQVYFGEFENGNTSDLENASNIAKNMITRYGMSDLGFGQISNPDGVLAQSIQHEINRMLKQCFDETVELVKDNKKKMDKVIDYLLKNKEIDEEELIKNFK